MKDETNKIVNWIEMGYTRLNYKEELSLVDYIKQLQQENKKYKEVIDKVIKEIKTELKENNHLSYGVALSIIVTLNYYEEILNKEE